MMARMKRLVVIGGGAAGLTAAVAAARAADGGALEVVVLEADERAGRSILATGNGRCNFSNAHIDAGAYRNAGFVAEALGELRARGERRARAGSGPAAAHTDGGDDDPVRGFFADVGLAWREEAEGRLYPAANKASSVLDVLRAAAADVGVRTLCNRRVVRIDAPTHAGERLHLRCADGAVEHADAVVVTVGGRGIDALELPCGLEKLPTEPTLGPLRTENALTKRLNNLRVRCTATLEDAQGRCKARERGEVLFRDYGVSGIAVFNLSRFARPGDAVCLNLLEGASLVEARELLSERRARLATLARELTYERLLCGLVLPQLAEELARCAGLRPSDRATDEGADALAGALVRLPLAVRGPGDARQCQVRRGGLAVEGFDARSLRAHALPGLYAAGEALDVDGPCGGYNLHWAWASGLLAGESAARSLLHGGAGRPRPGREGAHAGGGSHAGEGGADA